MSSVVIAGDVSGSVTLQAPAVSGSTILTLPATSGTVQTSGAGFTTNGVAYASSTSALATGSALVFDGTNLGVGIPSPATILNVVGTTGIRVRGANSASDGALELRADNTSCSINAATFGTAVPLLFKIDNTEAMRLTSTGLGIGTSSPRAKLNLEGGSTTSINATACWQYIGSGAAASYTSSNYMGIGFGYNNAGNSESPAFIGFTVTDPSASTNGALVFATRSVTTATAPTERMRITSDGNVAIGSTNADPLSLGRERNLAIVTTGTSGALTIIGGGNARIDFGVGSTRTGGMYSDAANFIEIYTSTALPIVFSTNSTQRARITSDGNLLVGTTSTVISSDERVGIVGAAGISVKSTSGASSFAGAFWNQATTGDNVFIKLYTETGGTERGSITYNRSGGLTVFNTTSDYRAKDISGAVTNSGALIDSVPVYMGKMKWATEERPMFLAHETPNYAHTGKKDAVDKDGNPVYQQMDASALIPVMWAEIQSLRQRLSAANL